MSEKLIINIYRKKSLEEFSELLSDSNSKLEPGSASAFVGALSASLLKRTADSLFQECSGAANRERVDYICRNSEIIRNYMNFLVDEDVKCRGPLKKAITEGNHQSIEACVQPACAINSEIVNMMGSLLDLLYELKGFSDEYHYHYICESAEYAMSAIKASICFIYHMMKLCTDETYIYVTKRENELLYSNAMEQYRSIIDGCGFPF